MSAGVPVRRSPSSSLCAPFRRWLTESTSSGSHVCALQVVAIHLFGSIDPADSVARVRAAAFFRNLNLGQPRSPGRLELLDAFERVGATWASSYRSNGTVVFDSAAPVRTAGLVVATLREVCGYDDAVVVRRAAWLREHAAAWEAVGERAEITLFDARIDFPEPLPWRPPRGGLTVVTADRSHALCVNDEPRTSFGTPALERLLGTRATSRSTGTMLGVVDRLS